MSEEIQAVITINGVVHPVTPEVQRYIFALEEMLYGPQAKESAVVLAELNSLRETMQQVLHACSPSTSPHKIVLQALSNLKVFAPSYPRSPIEYEALVGGLECRLEYLQKRLYTANFNWGEWQIRATTVEAVFKEVLSTFNHRGHPGEPCLKSDWVPEETFKRWWKVIDKRGEPKLPVEAKEKT